MKAIVYTEYGSPDVLRLTEVEKPAPKENEILVRIYATPVNFGDTLARNFKAVSMRKFTMPGPLWLPVRLMFGFNKPRNTILGSEFAGEIEAVGKDVTRFKVGDAVFGYRGMNMRTNAEYVCMREDGLITHKPSNMSFEEAAALPYGALTALNILRKANIQPGHKVLINGASGSIGAAALQFAKHYGAEVTGVCSTPRIDYVKSLGADKVIDYTQTDFTQNGETYDLIVDILGKSSFSRCKNSLKPNGRLLYASFGMFPLLQSFWTSIRGSKKVICALSSESRDDLLQVKALAEAGTLKTLIDRCFPLEQAADAHWYIEQGHKKGSVIITVQPQKSIQAPVLSERVAALQN